MIDATIIRQFEDALRSRNILPPEGGPIADGRIHRANTTGRNGKGDAAYLLYSDEPISGGYENWQDGLGWQTWTYQNHFGSKPTEEERRRWDEIKRKREQEREQERQKAEETAIRLWDASPPADPGHSYLKRKGIPPDGLRQDGESVLVPLQDKSGQVRNVQRIGSDGAKIFPRGASTAGLFFMVGPEGDPDDLVPIVEGAADAISVFRSSGKRTYAAMSSGNLLETGRMVRCEYPEARIVYFADNDESGIEKATEAAKATGARVVMSPNKGEDANDFFLTKGAEAVREILFLPEKADQITPSPQIVILEEMQARTVLELLEDSSLKEPEQVIEGLMALGDLTVLGGPPKAMKSWTVKAMGLMTATGTTWLGFTVPRPFRTIYLSAEGREARLRTRFQTLVGFTPVEEEGLERMAYVSTLGRLKLDTEPGERTFLRLIEPFEVVIIDPLYRFQAQGDENSHKDQRAIQDLFDRVKNIGKCIVLVHHVRKPTGINAGISELRGAGLDGFTDWAIMLSRKRDNSDERFTLDFTLRNYEDPPRMELIREGVILTPAPEEAKLRGGVSTLDVIEVLDRFGELKGTTLCAQIRELKGVSKATAERAVADAVRSPGSRIDWKPTKGPGQGRIYFLRENA
jgi:putative DNA primase/helicase